MIRWGINALNHGSSLAVFKDSNLVSLGTCKDDMLSSDVTVQALGWGAPDEIYWYERPWVKKARQIYAGQYKTAIDMSVLPSCYLKNMRVNYAKINYTPHHASHAAAGYYTSPFNHCAVVVLDAIGEFECASIWEGKYGKLKKVWSRSYPHSLGLFYSAFTQLIGLTPIRDEYLLQKMAAQGDPRKYYDRVRKYFNLEPVDLNYNFHRGVLDWNASELTNLQDQCDLAAAVQRVFEIQVEQVMDLAKTLTNADCLVYMGGCAMNSTANTRYVESKFPYRWSLPNPGDPSSAIGAVLYHTQNRIWDYKWDPVKHIAINV
jgi:carbamoyltransferase